MFLRLISQLNRPQFSAFSATGPTLYSLLPRPAPMPSMSTRASDTAKVARLTENKRRYRARRKEYIFSLEQRLAEARDQGVQATKQVQLAAQRVVRENIRLRELLRLAGFDDEDLDVWTLRTDCGDSKGGELCSRQRVIAQRARQCAPSLTEDGASATERKRISPPQESRDAKEVDQVASSAQNTGMTQGTAEPPVGDPILCDDPNHSVVVEANEDTLPGRAKSHDQLSPCRLLSFLAENPAADVTQLSIRPKSIGPPRDAVSAVVECGKAYEALLPYATSEENWGYIGKALEGGCRADGKGGCAVDKEVVWNTLDKMCG